jgi:hypothetical protein
MKLNNLSRPHSPIVLTLLCSLLKPLMPGGARKQAAGHSSQETKMTVCERICVCVSVWVCVGVSGCGCARARACVSVWVYVSFRSDFQSQRSR